MATRTRTRVGRKRPARTKAQRAAIAQRMREYHAKRRAAKVPALAAPTVETVPLDQHRRQVDHLVTTIDDLRTQVRDLIRVSLLLTLKLGGTH